MITVQAIHYTSRSSAWRRLSEALGLQGTHLDRGWAEFDAGGVLAVHDVTAGDPKDGTTAAHLLVDEVAATAAAAREAGAVVEDTPLVDLGPMVTVTYGSLVLTVSADARPAHGDPSVLPIFYLPDTTAPRDLLRALGLSARVVADNDVWVDLAADGGGLIALHQGEQRTELAFEYVGDLDDLAVRVEAAGFDVVIVDEAYNRTLRIDAPGLPGLCVNGAQHDLYGYHLAS